MYIIRKKYYDEHYYNCRGTYAYCRYAPEVCLNAAHVLSAIQQCINDDSEYLESAHTVWSSTDVSKNRIGVKLYNGDELRVEYDVLPVTVGTQLFHRGKNGKVYGTQITKFTIDEKERIVFWFDKYGGFTGVHLGFEWFYSLEEAVPKEPEKYTVVVEAEIDGEEFIDVYHPASQEWKDIIACYEAELQNVKKEIGDENVDAAEEWTLNETQPAAKFDIENGYYEIFVCRCKDY